jgi:ADP-L-glycero-D-manno-heptose 6-epimerase
MKRIIVTGGGGFVGANLVQQLQEDEPDAALLVIDDFRSGSFVNLVPESRPNGGGGFSYRGEVIGRSLVDLDLFSICDEFAADTIFHEASITDTTVDDEAKMIVDNIEPFEMLLDVAVQTGAKLIWASSAATYGTSANGATAARRPFRVTDAGHPANVYGFSKWIMENLHRKTVEAYPDVHIVGLRYFNVFGPGEQSKAHMASMIYQLANQALDGKPPRIFYDGEQARDHVYVRDVVDCTIAAAADDAVNGIYNVGTGAATSFNEIISAINEALGTDYKPDYFENPYRFYQDYTCADLAETRKGLNWSPRYETREAIIEYVAWLASLRS